MWVSIFRRLRISEDPNMFNLASLWKLEILRFDVSDYNYNCHFQNSEYIGKLMYSETRSGKNKNKSQRENLCIPLTIRWQHCFNFYFFFSTYCYTHLFSLHGNPFLFDRQPFSLFFTMWPPYSAQTIFMYVFGYD